MNINVDEDELTGLRRASPTATATTTVASFTGAQIIAGLVASGADEPVTVSLNAAIDDVATGLISKGDEHPVRRVSCDAGERRGGCPHGVHAGADGGR